MQNSEQAQTRIELLRKAFLSGMLQDEPQEATEPILSIVTIYDNDNEVKWLDDFIANLPELSVEYDGEIEVCLVKCIKDKYTNESPKPPETRNGVAISYYLVYLDEWDFAEARNAAKQAACGKWILSLDTDENLMQNEVATLIQTLRKAPLNVGGYTLNICSPIGDGSKYDRTKATRIFRNVPKIKWHCAIHEQVAYSIVENGYVIAEIPINIFHAGYVASNEELITKLERNLTMICKEYATRKETHYKMFMRDYLFKTVKHIQEVENAEAQGKQYS